MTRRRLIAVAIALNLFAANAQGNNLLLRGQREAPLQVYQVESGGIVRQWTVPTIIDVVLETNFDDIRLVGLFVDEQATVFEDASQNFEFDFHLSATVRGDWTDIDSSEEDWWTTGFVDEQETIIVELDRSIFGNSTHYYNSEQPNHAPAAYGINFGGFPTNVLYRRSTVSWTDFGHVSYAPDRSLSFVLEWPGETSLAVTNGDFDNDGDVDGRDFLKWQRDDGSAASLALWSLDYGTSMPPTTISVPEGNPSLLCLMAVVRLLTRSAIRRYPPSP